MVEAAAVTAGDAAVASAKAVGKVVAVGVIVVGIGGGVVIVVVVLVVVVIDLLEVCVCRERWFGLRRRAFVSSGAVEQCGVYNASKGHETTLIKRGYTSLENSRMEQACAAIKTVNSKTKKEKKRKYLRKCTFHYSKKQKSKINEHTKIIKTINTISQNKTSIHTKYLKIKHIFEQKQNKNLTGFPAELFTKTSQFFYFYIHSVTVYRTNAREKNGT